MNREGSGDLPSESFYTHTDAENDAFRAVSPLEIPPTVSNAPYHVGTPAGAITPYIAADAGEGSDYHENEADPNPTNEAEIAEPPLAAGGGDTPNKPPDTPREASGMSEEPHEFNDSRFETRELTPLEALRAVALFEKGKTIIENSRLLFLDTEVATSDRSNLPHNAEIATYLDLQRALPEGVIDVKISSEGVSTAYTDAASGETTHNLYYRDGDSIRRDNRDPNVGDAYMPEPGEVPISIYWRTRMERLRARQNERRLGQELGMIDPTVSMGELQQVFDHAALAQPTPKQYTDVYNVVARMSRSLIPLTVAETLHGAGELDRVVSAYINENADTADPSHEDAVITTVHGNTGNSIVVSVGFVPNPKIQQPEPFVRIAAKMTAEGENIANALYERGQPKDLITTGSFRDIITVGVTTEGLTCTLQTALHDHNDNVIGGTPDSGFSTTRNFAGDASIARVLRNFLLSGNRDFLI